MRRDQPVVAEEEVFEMTDNRKENKIEESVREMLVVWRVEIDAVVLKDKSLKRISNW